MKNNEICALIADRIVEQLDKGVVPWQKPWVGGSQAASSYVSRKTYSFVNQMLLGDPGEYITFAQAKKIGGNVKKGARSKKILFWNIYKYDSDGNMVTEKDDNREVARVVPYMKWWSVFSVDDTENIKKHADDDLPRTAKENRSAEEIIEEYAKREELEIQRDELSGRAYYSITNDYIRIPSRDQFAKTSGYYSTIFHEIAHSTGAIGRLNRFDNNPSQGIFGSGVYSKEELVAEITAAALIYRLGLETETSFNNSASYCECWKKAIKNDNSLIVEAAAKAEKAFKFILNIKEDETAKS